MDLYVNCDDKPPSDIDRKLTASGAVKLPFPTHKYNSTSVFDALPGSKAGVGAVELTTSGTVGKPRQLPKALLPKDARRPSAAAAQPVKPGLPSVTTVEPRRNSLAARYSSSRLSSQLSETPSSAVDVGLQRSERVLVGPVSPTRGIVKPRQRSVVYEPNAGLLMLRQLKADKADEVPSSAITSANSSSVNHGDSGDDVFPLRSTTKFVASTTSSSNRRTSFADTLSFFSTSLTSGSGTPHDAQSSSRPSYVPKKSLKYHRFNTLDDETSYDVSSGVPTSSVGLLKAVEPEVIHSCDSDHSARYIERCQDKSVMNSLKSTSLTATANARNTNGCRVEETTFLETRGIRDSPAASVTTRLTSPSTDIDQTSVADTTSRDPIESDETVESPLDCWQQSDAQRLRGKSKSQCSESADDPDLPPLPTSLPPPPPATLHGHVTDTSPVFSVDDDVELRSAADGETSSDSGVWNAGGTMGSGLVGWYLNSSPSGVGSGLVVYSHRPTDSNATIDSGHGSTMTSDSHDDNGSSSGDEPEVVDSAILQQSPVMCGSNDILPLHGSLRKSEVAFSEKSISSSTMNDDIDTVVKAVSDAAVCTRGLLDHLLADNGTTLADLEHEMLSCSSMVDGNEVRVDDTVDSSDNIIAEDEESQRRSSFGDGEEQVDDEASADGVGLHTTFDVAIVKGALGLGFCIEGGLGSAAGDRPLRIKRLFRNMDENASGSVTLKAGDEIIAVNGISFGNLSHYEAWNRLKALPDGTFVLTLRR